MTPTAPTTSGPYKTTPGPWQWFEVGKGWSTIYPTRRACEYWQCSYKGNTPTHWSKPK